LGYLLDTSVAIHLRDGDQAIKQHLLELDERGGSAKLNIEISGYSA
jgi:hypothetical protein